MGEGSERVCEFCTAAGHWSGHGWQGELKGNSKHVHRLASALILALSNHEKVTVTWKVSPL